MTVVEEGWRFASWLRDRAYDTVFHVGDTALQFTAELIRGPENTRHQPYVNRQLNKQERKILPATSKAQSEKPLNYDERQLFTQMMRRRVGESLTLHWKRRKELIQHPRKRQLIATERKIEAASQKDRSIIVERRNVATQYQQHRVRKQTRNRKRGR